MSNKDSKEKIVLHTYGKKVFVAMSGGVDSSVAATLLKEEGYDVTGVFMKVWYPDFLTCTWPEDRLDAMRVCAKLSIPFLTFDFEKEYKKNVVDYMVSEYKAGRTPNPDVMCNKHIKFEAFFKKARKMGVDYIATGHYARINTQQTTDNTQQTNKLLVGVDTNKDQSYFLWTLTQEILRYTLFPIGKYVKSDVRKLAKKFYLPTAEKKDSQGLCFLGKIDMKEFLKNYISEKIGDVLNENNEIIGYHDGVMFYTIGQRHGFVITKQQSNELPHYIVSKNLKKNVLIVSNDPQKKLVQNIKNSIQLTNINWIKGIPPVLNKKLKARTRYRQKLYSCRVEKADANQATVLFSVKSGKQRPIAPPGQSLVLYDDEECLGGGIIC